MNKNVDYSLPLPHVLEHFSCMFEDRNERHWKTRLEILYNNTCLITGLKAEKGKVSLDAHHLYSKAIYPKAAKHFWNGILMESKLHRLYHKDFSKNAAGVTVESFLFFLERLEKRKGFYLKTESVQLELFVPGKGLELVRLEGEPIAQKDHQVFVFIPLDKERIKSVKNHLQGLDLLLKKNNLV